VENALQTIPMKLLFLLPLIALCSCATVHQVPKDTALDKQFITVCNQCGGEHVLRPVASRTIGSTNSAEGNGFMVSKVLTFKCACCKCLFTQESEPLFEPIRPKALLAK
jgi:hypothetical protein